MYRITKVAFLFLAATFELGCTTFIPPIHYETISGNFSGSRAISRPDLVRKNEEILKDRYEKEWAFNNNIKKPPQLGLSLSGGGTRSASFSIGVLKALNEAGVLDQIDIISTVSGGGYALYWLYQQEYYRVQLHDKPKYRRSDFFESFDFNKHGFTNYDFDNYRDGDGPSDYGLNRSDPNKHSRNCATSNDNCPLNIKYRFQHHLEDNSYLMVRSKSRFYQLLDYAEKTGWWFLTLPANMIFNWLFGMDINTNPIRLSYEHGIERTYGLVPPETYIDPNGQDAFCPDDKGYPNGECYFGVFDAQAEDLEFSELKQFLLNKKDGHLPFFVINATADYSDADSWFNKFATTETSLSKVIFEFTPLHYGSDAFDYRDQREQEEIHFSRAISISGAALDYKAKELGFWGSMFLTASDLNLGYKLINYNHPEGWIPRRFPIWPFYYLNNYIHDRDATAIHLSDGGHVENLGVFSLVKRGVKNIIVIDAEQDSKSKYEGLKNVRVAIRKELDMDFDVNVDADDKNVFDKKNPVTVGRVRLTSSELPDCRQPDTKECYRVFYLKLSIDKNRIDPLRCTNDCYPWTVISYYSKNHKEGDEITLQEFPQESTSDIEYSAEQYRAYRDLGYVLAKERLVDALKKANVISGARAITQ